MRCGGGWPCGSTCREKGGRRHPAAPTHLTSTHLLVLRAFFLRPIRPENLDDSAQSGRGVAHSDALNDACQFARWEE